MTIQRLLVANRGEIARRVFRTCRTLGIETVAVFSDADADLPFVREADVAVRLPGSTPGETYLRGDLVVEAAQKAGADAVHPGYGFLSENADFARAVIDAGLTWVGPTPESIDAMGSKVGAKKLMESAGVPVLGEIAPETVSADDLPLLVKASAGGGGRGMRVVRSVDDVAAQVELAANEAASAFGDPTVFCEPYVEHGRHVEVQVVGDVHGTVLVLGERDCSIQRRHQKVVEETPAPGLTEETRVALHGAARRAAEAIGYVGAGTVEFLLSGDRFFFLEMNTRLQVEHPVTELVTGQDLVALQVAVAEGRALDPSPVPHPTGHAVEVRLYAEDPAAGWQPQSGRLTRFDIPGVTAEFENPSSFGVRLDSGFEAGSEVGTHYDAMLAKVVAWAPTREQAFRRLAGTLSHARIHGLRTNRDLLVEVLRHDAVVAGDVSTDFFDRHGLAALGGDEHGWGSVMPAEVSAHAAALALAEHEAVGRKVQRRMPVAWRNVVSQPQLTRFAPGHVDGSKALADDAATLEVAWHGGRDGYRFDHQDLPALDATSIRAVRATTDRVVLAVNGVETAFEVSVRGDLVDVDSAHGHVELTRLPRFVDPADQVATGSLLAPMPGTVVSIAAAVGDHVSAGAPVLVLEAMKMQHTVSAPHDGVVVDLPVNLGDQVASDAVLAVVQEQTEAPADPAAEGDSND
ncbi:MAG TPA: biotin carboxylase N-terminal domain-containing protein [Nocardioidaceae bacterium]|nr:biotin carboxylase N-terminal domain-containing protein [Nocardioidaceae bacterium]